MDAMISPPTLAAENEYAPSSAAYVETVTEVTHYTERLFRFRTTRPCGFRFRSGEFIMIGLMVDGKPLYRAYSIASPSWDEELEFFSIKVPDGPLTFHLQKIEPGSPIFIRKKATGTLVNDALIDGKRLYMLSTGTGIAPFASIIRDPETYEKFDELILTHTCRTKVELQYGIELISEIKRNELLNELFDTNKLRHYPTVTREPYDVTGRITDLIKSEKVFQDLSVPVMDPSIDRAMICGSVDMIKDTSALLENFGLQEGANNNPSQFVIERAFAG